MNENSLKIMQHLSDRKSYINFKKHFYLHTLQFVGHGTIFFVSVRNFKISYLRRVAIIF